MRLLLGHDADVAAWVAAHIPQMQDSLGFGPCAAIGVLDAKGAPMGGVVFHNYQPTFRTIDLSGAAVSARWLTRRIVHDILAYPFEQLDCLRISSITAKRNHQARAVLEKLGFRREGGHRLGFGVYGDAISYGLLQREWRAGRFGSVVSPALTAPGAPLPSLAEAR